VEIDLPRLSLAILRCLEKEGNRYSLVMWRYTASKLPSRLFAVDFFRVLSRRMKRRFGGTYGVA
jgi:hypothetical protein